MLASHVLRARGCAAYRSRAGAKLRAVPGAACRSRVVYAVTPNPSLQRTAPSSLRATAQVSTPWQLAVVHAACGARVAPAGLVVPAVGAAAELNAVRRHSARRCTAPIRKRESRVRAALRPRQNGA